MEENRNRKFVCKFCHKRFLCGKALGGHIRSHKYGHTIEAEEAKINKIKSKSYMGDESGLQSGYVLGENPIKSRRLSDSSITSLNQEKVCKECGKGFSSSKALCGHMACHSEKEKNKIRKNRFKDHSGSGGNLKLISDHQLETETSGPGGQRRSKRLRYKTIGVYPSQFSLSNGSLSASDIEQEQEEVAISLMMLSRDFRYRGCPDSVVESSENHSVTLDAKSSSIDMKIDSKNGFNCGTVGNEFVALKRTRDGNFKGSEPGLSENSDSGYFRNEPRKVESDVSVDGFHRNLKIKKPNGQFCSQFEHSDAEMGKGLINYKCKKLEFLEKDMIGEEGCEEVDRASMKHDSRIRVENEYESLTSRHSLGGRRASHNKINGCCGSMNEISEDSIDDEYVPTFIVDPTTVDTFRKKKPLEQDLSENVEKKMVSKKGKVHECPICFRVFRSGQALGGHKRSHFVGGSEDRSVVIEQEPSEMPSLIDLNLPAPIEEEAYMPW
ncbi:zinc finger protein ZAT9-like [Tripterygium wilfordii]|uniref:zinc finger protein ZAT9-like n=1 Tax=Tripterygium wilfordii TaxID=458696 RepID=UPI0018F84359|nr:zinc finger protein ZAT9-like [Tripterygium wilfordii]